MNATRLIMRQQIPLMLADLIALKLQGSQLPDVIAGYAEWLQSKDCTVQQFKIVRNFLTLIRGSRNESS